MPTHQATAFDLPFYDIFAPTKNSCFEVSDDVIACGLRFGPPLNQKFWLRLCYIALFLSISTFKRSTEFYLQGQIKFGVLRNALLDLRLNIFFRKTERQKALRTCAVRIDKESDSEIAFTLDAKQSEASQSKSKRRKATKM